MIGRPPAGSDTIPWLVYVCEQYGPVNPTRVRRVKGWDAMVDAVRREIDECGQSGDEAAKTDAADLLAWLDSHYRTCDYSLKITFFHVGRDTVCVHLREPVASAA